MVTIKSQSYTSVYTSFQTFAVILRAISTASLVAQMVKNPPAMWETWVHSLGWEDLLEWEMAAQYSCLENFMAQRVGQN